jgi:hypothetical protein
MSRRTQTLLLLATLGAALTVPAGSASAGCTSDLPASDPRAALVTCTGVRVGMSMIVPSKKWGPMECAASFAFTDQFHQRYVAFPGTCFLDYDCLEDAVVGELPPPLDELVGNLALCVAPGDSELEPYYKRGGPAVTDLDGKRVGAIVYAVNKHDVDFALARIDDGVRLDPSMPHWGGPVSKGALVAGAVDEVRVYSPPLVGVTPNARAGVITGTRDLGYVFSSGLFTEIPNGSSVMRPNGTALGFLTGAFTNNGFETQPLGPGLGAATSRTGLRFTLMTAPLKKK